ncbi:MAG: M20/M25/M40 family metallo-hydrolase [Corynebacterium sp.]|nr:M20/M25/M40 family metallo-hydrolase [Corynebacterium sp.]
MSEQPKNHPLFEKLHSHFLGTETREYFFTNLSELVAFNSVHSTPSLADDLDGACAWVASKLEGFGFEVSQNRTVDKSQVIVAQRHFSQKLPTVLLYAHYDVVPVNNPEDWTSDPFTLTERDGRWYGRGAADCKGNVVMHLGVLAALEKFGFFEKPTANITVIVEGSEEMGGEGLHHFLAENPELFRADRIMIADSGNAALGVPTLTTSLRGGAQVLVRVDTLKTPVHSGALGGPAPDAVTALVKLLDTLHNDRGETTIDGVKNFENWEGRAYDATQFAADAGVLEGVSLPGKPEDIASALWARPAVTITGFSSTPVEKAINAVPATASANLNLRVPAGLNTAETVAALEAHLRAHTPWNAQISIEISDVNEPFAGGIDTVMADCLSAAYEGQPTQLIGSGGSIPLCTELQELFPDAQLALYGVEEPTCAIHSVDESVDPEEIARIALAEALFLLSI